VTWGRHHETRPCYRLQVQVRRKEENDIRIKKGNLSRKATTCTGVALETKEAVDTSNSAGCQSRNQGRAEHAPRVSITLLLFFFFFMKRTHQVWSWNAMLTPCLANNARTDLKTSCHGGGRSRLQSRLHSFSEKPVIEHSQTREGRGSGTSKLSSKEPLLQEEGDGSLVRYQDW
jgi:hypothetical protein